MARPLKYETCEELNEAIELYFKDIEKDERKPTVTGLSYHLGFESRQSMYDYKERPKFSYSIKRAVLYIESLHEENLYTTGAAGSIFWLKNRGWKDKTETDLNVTTLPKLDVQIVKPDESK